jgi:hypothetical protein
MKEIDMENKVDRKWFEMKKLEVRKGNKEGWFEMKVVNEKGELVKLIGRKVNRFWSEEVEESESGM